MTTRLLHSCPHIDSADSAAVASVLAANFPGTGPWVEKLEGALRQRTGQEYGVAVQSGFQALVLALRALDLPPGSRVALPVLTCSSVAAAILNAGLEPVLCDISEDLTIDLERLPAGCAAVVAPHAYGAPVDVSALQKLGLPWIEDCATSPATSIDSKPVGRFGTLAIFSFASTKYLTGGNGGAVLCRDVALSARLQDLLSIDSLTCSPTWRHGRPIPFPGRMSNLQAALVSSQLARLPSFLEHRSMLAALYTQELAGCEGLLLPPASPGHSWYRFIVRTISEAAPIARELQQAGWDVRETVNPWLHRHYICEGQGSYPATESFEGHLLSLPIHLQVAVADARLLAQTLRHILEPIKT